MGMMFAKFGGGITSGMGSSNEVLNQMTIDLPLRALYSFSKVTEDQMRQLIYVLNEQLK